MALVFPLTPGLNDQFGKWRYDGAHWRLHDPAAPFVSKAGDTMLGQLVLDDDAAQPLEATPLRQVEDLVASSSLYQGLWQPQSNTPDLSVTTSNRTGFAWVVQLSDPTQPFVTTTALPGIPVGTELKSGDRVVWSATSSTYGVIPGGAGIPPGGDLYEVLRKDSAANYDADWVAELDRGNGNTAGGAGAFAANTTGTGNTALGRNALLVNAAGVQNVALGLNALAAANTSQNAAVGAGALSGLTSGGNNTAVGANAGQSVGGGVVPNQTGSLSVFLGHDARPLTDGDSNEIVIGNAARGQGSNTITLGDANVTDLYTNAYQRFPQGLLARDPSATYEIATKNYVDNAAVQPVSGPFPYIFSLPLPSSTGNSNFPNGYALSIPGWTTASRDVFFVRGNPTLNIYAHYMQLNINGTGWFPIVLQNAFAPSNFNSNNAPVSTLGVPQTGPGYVFSGAGTYQVSVRNPRVMGNYSTPSAMVLQLIALQFNGSQFVQVSDNLLQYQLQRRLGVGRSPTGIHSFGNSRTATAGGAAQEVWFYPHTDFCNVSLTGTAGGLCQVRFRTADWSVISIHNREFRNQPRRLILYNGPSAYTLRLIPYSDSWADNRPSGNFTMVSAYRLKAPKHLYDSGSITSAVGAGYIEIPIPASTETEIYIKTMEDTGAPNTLYPYRLNPTQFINTFPACRTVVYVSDIRTYVTP